jgi:hypothetical protein
MNQGSSMNQQIDLEAVKSDAIQRYGDLPGVEGIGIADQSLRIYTLNSEVRKQLPQQFQGVPIDFVVTGDIVTDW